MHHKNSILSACIQPLSTYPGAPDLELGRVSGLVALDLHRLGIAAIEKYGQRTHKEHKSSGNRKLGHGVLSAHYATWDIIDKGTIFTAASQVPSCFTREGMVMPRHWGGIILRFLSVACRPVWPRVRPYPVSESNGGRMIPTSWVRLALASHFWCLGALHKHHTTLPVRFPDPS